MRVQFARGKSDALTKLEGTYVPRERGSGVDNRIKSNAASKAAAVVKNLKAMDQPNQILFLQNLPEDTDINTLKLLFGQLPGFKELRTIPKRSDIAFVEYESESYSKSAKESLQGFKITPAHALKINYAKK
uniref:U2 small nuclear ribonucleoprotein B'' (Trinotate prediction) n=1 Tax=Henneguya salminicola TaxID=69463 RepID=A0A6G3MLL6_HENSL